MIRTAITGAESRDAGELIRILVNHPDVELISFVSAEKEGLPLTAVHHGLIGECDATFDEDLDTRKTDAVIWVGSETPTISYAEGNPKLIWFPAMGDTRKISNDMVYGQPEMNRKPLVRGARVALVPSPVASAFIASMVPLLPLLPANGEMAVTVMASDLILKQLAADANIADEISAALRQLRPDLQCSLKINRRTEGYDRVARLKITLPIKASQDEIESAYEKMYDDHNFSYVVTDAVAPCEVEGSEKCLISVHAREGYVHIDSVADLRMRGGAGEAVHLLNLLFGLHERTGLKLKSTSY